MTKYSVQRVLRNQDQLGLELERKQRHLQLEAGGNQLVDLILMPVEYMGARIH